MLLGGHRGGTCQGQEVDTRPGWSEASGCRKSGCVLASSCHPGVGAERDPCVRGTQGMPLQLGRIQGPTRPRWWSPVGP